MPLAPRWRPDDPLVPLMDPTKPTARHHGPSLPLPSLRSLRDSLPKSPPHPQARKAQGPAIDYHALRKRQAAARAASVQKWIDRCNAVLRKPKADGASQPPLDAYVECTTGGAPYIRATAEQRAWFGRTYVVDVDTVTQPRGGAVRPAEGAGGGDVFF